MQESHQFSRALPSLNKGPKPGSAIAADSEKCQILAKKGFLSARGITSGLVLLVYSKQFQLGVLLRLPELREQLSLTIETEEELFAKSAISMIMAEFETLGVKKERLVTYVVGGSSSAGGREVSRVSVKRALWKYGLTPSACDVGGKQVRSIWMEVESGRTIVRSERIVEDAPVMESPLSVAS
jgi:chemotaxis receptor (MCP) glutamine deamidase CheD